MALDIPMSKLLEKLDEYSSNESRDKEQHSTSNESNIPLQIYELISCESIENQQLLLEMIICALNLTDSK